MNQFCPANGSETDWQEAQSRAEAYLVALHLTDPKQKERVVQAALERAAIKHAQNPPASPTTLVMHEVHELSERWFEKLVPSADRVFVTGMVSWLAIDGFKKWPAALLAEEVPADLQRAIGKGGVRAAPDLKVSRMVPQPFDNLLGDLNLPTALGQLTKDLSPSLVARVAGFIVSGFAFLSGNRMR